MTPSRKWRNGLLWPAGTKMDELTHTIEMMINGPHEKQRTHVSTSGDGGLAHMLEVFKAALIASGFTLDTVRKFEELDDDLAKSPGAALSPVRWNDLLCRV